MAKPKQTIDDDLLREIISAVVGELDYDHAKELDPETAEEPDRVEELWEDLLAAARRAVKDYR